MNPCQSHIESVYLHPKITTLISKIKPSELQDDLRQELAVILLEFDCQRLLELYAEGNLIKFALGIVWNLGATTNSPFYKKYKKNDYYQAIDYFKSQKGLEIPIQSVALAQSILKSKMNMDANNAHESMIFEKYVELRSCKDVAAFFNITHYHVLDVVKKTKEELKKAIKNI